MAFKQNNAHSLRSSMTACKNSFECDARSDLTSATEAGTLVEYDGAFPRGETLHFFYNSSVDFGSRSVFDAFRGSGKGIPFPRKTDEREKMKKKSIPLCQPFETPSPAAAETATRPLAFQNDGSWFTYGHDLTKNVWEVFNGIYEQKYYTVRPAK